MKITFVSLAHVAVGGCGPLVGLQIGDKLSRRLSGLFGGVAFQSPQISQQFLIFLVYTFRIVRSAFVVAVFGRIRLGFQLFADLFLLDEAGDDVGLSKRPQRDARGQLTFHISS